MNARGWHRRVVACVCLIALTATLSGCEQVLPNTGNVSISRDGDALFITFCDAVSLDKILVETAHRGWGADGFVQTAYIAQVGARVSRGFVLRTDSDVDGVDVTLRSDLRLDEANEISVTGSSDVPGESVSVVFDLDSNALPVEGWLRPDGSVSDEAC